MSLKKHLFDDISLVITSSGRADLLVKTLASMQPWVYLFTEKILVDDAQTANVKIRQIAEDYGFHFLSNQKQLGQHQSIDRAYKYVSKPYIFHCEDDWQFNQCPDIRLAKKLLELSYISCVCTRKIDDRCRSKYPDRTIKLDRYQSAELAGEKYLTIKQHWHPTRGAFTFNPNLIKTAFYKTIGPYRRYSSEREISASLKQQGYLIAFEPQGTCSHIGWNRHIQDPTKLPRTHTFFGKLERSYIKRARRIKSRCVHLLHPFNRRIGGKNR